MLRVTPSGPEIQTFNGKTWQEQISVEFHNFGTSELINKESQNPSFLHCPAKTPREERKGIPGGSMR